MYKCLNCLGFWAFVFFASAACFAEVITVRSSQELTDKLQKSAQKAPGSFAVKAFLNHPSDLSKFLSDRSAQALVGSLSLNISGENLAVPPSKTWAYLEKFQHLREIEISANFRLTQESFPAFVSALKGNDHLESIRLPFGLNSVDTFLLLNSLPLSNQIKTFDFSGNDLRAHAQGSQDFLSLIAQRFPNLESLFLELAQVPGTIRGLLGLSGLKSLNLSALVCSEGIDFETLASALAQMTSLEELNLAALEGDLSEVLVKALSNKPHLRSLNLLGHDFSKTKMTALTAGLFNVKQLEVLHLGKIENVKSVYDGLKTKGDQSGSLKELFLSHVPSGNSDATYLSLLIHENASLANLSFSIGKTSDSGLQRLALSIRKSKLRVADFMVELDADGNSVGGREKGLHRLKTLLDSLPSSVEMLTFDVSSPEEAQIYAHAIESLPHLRSVQGLTLSMKSVKGPGWVALSHALLKKKRALRGIEEEEWGIIQRIIAHSKNEAEAAK